MSQNLEELGLLKIADDIHKRLEPLCAYFLLNYGIELKSIVLNKLHSQIPTKLEQPQGYVTFTTESKK